MVLVLLQNISHGSRAYCVEHEKTAIKAFCKSNSGINPKILGKKLSPPKEPWRLIQPLSPQFTNNVVVKILGYVGWFQEKEKAIDFYFPHDRSFGRQMGNGIHLPASKIMQQLSKNSRAYYIFVNEVGLSKFVGGAKKQEALRHDWVKLEEAINYQAILA